MHGESKRRETELGFFSYVFISILYPLPYLSNTLY